MITEACVLLHKDGGQNIICVVGVAVPSMPKEKINTQIFCYFNLIYLV